MHAAHPAAPAVIAAITGLALAAPAFAQGWSNAGGNAGRNGSTALVGPDAPTPLWTRPRPSLIAWIPVIDGRRVFTVRQTSFPPEPAAGTGSTVYALDLDTGAELWFFNIPFVTGDWTTHILGATGGRVYATRAGGGGAVSPPPTGQSRIYALDAATGAVAWVSPVGTTTAAGPYEGAVFADNGDLITADQISIKRFRATDGTLVYSTPRTGSVSGNATAAFALRPGAAPAIYAVDAAPGGNILRSFNASTGAPVGQSTVLTGFTVQNGPFVGPDGRIYLSRTQNNALTDRFYAFTDPGGPVLPIAWDHPAGWTTSSEGAATAAAAYMVNPAYQLEKRDAATGALQATSTITLSSYAQRLAVDGQGRVFASDAATNRVHSLNPDLSLRWTLQVPGNLNIGAPALGVDRTLIVASSTAVYAYRTAPPPTCYPNCDGSTSAPVLNALDFSCFLSRFQASDPYANCDGSTSVPTLNALDFGCFLQRYRAGCN